MEVIGIMKRVPRMSVPHICRKGAFGALSVGLSVFAAASGAQAAPSPSQDRATVYPVMVDAKTNKLVLAYSAHNGTAKPVSINITSLRVYPNKNKPAIFTDVDTSRAAGRTFSLEPGASRNDKISLNATDLKDANLDRATDGQVQIRYQETFRTSSGTNERDHSSYAAPLEVGAIKTFNEKIEWATSNDSSRFDEHAAEHFDEHGTTHGGGL